MTLVEEAQKVSKSQTDKTLEKYQESDCSVIVLLPHLFPKKAVTGYCLREDLGGCLVQPIIHPWF